MAISTEQTIESATTGTGQSDSFEVLNRPVTVQVFGTLASSTADLQRQASDDSWVDVYDDNGKVTLSDTRPQETVWGGGRYRLNWTARPSAVGASVSVGPGGR